jgi:TonB family protein
MSSRRAMRPTVLAMLGFVLIGAPVGVDAQSAPTRAPSSPPTCEFRMNVAAIDAKRVALRFFTSGPSMPISGTAALYAGDRRYDVAFHNAYARTTDVSGYVDVQPVVVRFPGPVDIDGVVITAVDAPPQPACREQSHPFIAWKFPLDPGSGEGQAFLARVNALPALDAPPPLMLPHTCPARNAHGRTVAAATPRYGAGNGGVATVLVSIDAADHVAGVRLLHSSGDDKQDASALETARLSTYETDIFNCVKRANDFVFTVSF